LAREVAVAIDEDSYPSGVTRRIVELLVQAGDPIQAFASWECAFDIVSYRLPRTGPHHSIFCPPGPDLEEEETPVAFAELLASTTSHAEFERRASAIAGLSELTVSRSSLGVAGFRFLLTQDATFTESIAALCLLAQPNQSDASILRALDDLLATYGVANSFGLQEGARTLLRRLGRDTPFSALRPLAAGPSPTDLETDEACRLDPANRARRLGRLWENFPKLVAGRFWNIWRRVDRYQRILTSQREHEFFQNRNMVATSSAL
jgi:hypothetical protein